MQIGNKPQRIKSKLVKAASYMGYFFKRKRYYLKNLTKILKRCDIY